MNFALFTAFGLGFLYFVSAIPVAVMAGASLWAAAAMAWLGYSVGGALVILLGAPLRSWLIRKMNLSLEPDSQKMFWKMWRRYGAIGVGIIAPITLGPQVATLLLLMLGESPKKILGSITLGALPWVLGFSFLIILKQLGTHAFLSS